MATEILMPQMGESIAEGTLTRWLAKVGDTVERDQPLLEISTDKVDAEIPAPASGVLLQILHQDGETVPVNEVIGFIGQEGESVGTGTADGGGAATAAQQAEPEAAEATSSDSEGEATSLEDRVRRFSSPLVRRIAEKEGVDLAQVAGTGLHGRVTKNDILAYVEAGQKGEVPAAPAAKLAPSAAPATGPAARPATPAAGTPAAGTPAAGSPAATSAPPIPASRGGSDFAVPAYVAGENVRIEPMSRIRQITAEHMVYSKATSAHVSTVFHVDLSRVAALRARAKGRFQKDVGTKLTYMPFIFKAVCQGLRRFPQLNAALNGSEIVYKNDVNLGMAVALEKGLIVPVLKHADEKNLVGLARAANDLADRARNKKLSLDDVKGGTFTITNPGVFGSLFGMPIINQPQVAILGIGTIEKRAMVHTDADGNDMIAIRTMCYFSLTFDHRLIDGADADHFMNTIKDALEDGEWDELASYL